MNTVWEKMHSILFLYMTMTVKTSICPTLEGFEGTLNGRVVGKADGAGWDVESNGYD